MMTAVNTVNTAKAATPTGAAKHATTIATPSDRKVVITRVVDAPRRLVWEAWTNPRHLRRWMCPTGSVMSACEIDLRPGGAWRFVVRGPDGTEVESRGVYREVAPPGRLVCTRSWGGDWPETLNTLVLTKAGGTTTITLTVRYPSEAARDAALGTGVKEGKPRGLDCLAEPVRATA